MAEAEGVYTLPLWNPGTYRLTVSAAGFKKYVQSGVIFNLGDALTLQTETGERGLVVDKPQSLSCR